MVVTSIFPNLFARNSLCINVSSINRIHSLRGNALQQGNALATSRREKEPFAASVYKKLTLYARLSVYIKRVHV